MSNNVHNAASSFSGWRFQVNAAIALFVRFLPEVEYLVVEGTEDIEFGMLDKTCILCQAKSTFNNDPGKGATERFNSALKTLKEDCLRAECSRCLYVTNDRRPFGKSRRDDLFDADTLFCFEELSTEAQTYITGRCEELGVDTDALLPKLGVYVLNYRGIDNRTRTETVRKIIDDFLVDLGIGARVNAEKLRGVWDLLLQGNAENHDPAVRVTKERLAWPIVVQVCSLSSDDTDLVDRDDDVREAVCDAYGSLIDDASERFDLVAIIEADFAEFRRSSGSGNLGEDRKRFAEAHYGNYLGPIGAEGLDEEVAEVLARQVVRKVLLRQQVIAVVREGMNLAH